MYKNFLKSIFDFAVAAALLLLCLPLFAAVALCIKLDSPGPVFFRQRRGGRNGRYFTMLKFRSMTEKNDSSGKEFEPGAGRRVTGVGRILRKKKLDELPQLVNVFRGEMSLVGPRPEVETYISLYPERWEKILEVKPGITDPASVKFRNEEEILAKAQDPEEEYRKAILPAKLEIYEDYAGKISFIGDLKVIVQTLVAVLKG